MAKSKGRKRKTGLRSPSGQLRDVASTSYAPAAIHRAMHLAMDPSLATALGRMRVHQSSDDKHRISEKYYTAGMTFADVYRRYESVMGMPRRSTKPPSYERGGGGGSGADIDPQIVETVRRKFDAVMELLKMADPMGRMASILVKVCVDDVPPDWWEKDNLILGLQILTLHFDGKRRVAPSGPVQTIRVPEAPVVPVVAGEGEREAV